MVGDLGCERRIHREESAESRGFIITFPRDGKSYVWRCVPAAALALKGEGFEFLLGNVVVAPHWKQDFSVRLQLVSMLSLGAGSCC